MLYQKPKFSVPASAGTADACKDAGSHCGPDAKGRCLRCGQKFDAASGDDLDTLMSLYGCRVDLTRDETPPKIVGTVSHMESKQKLRFEIRSHAGDVPQANLRRQVRFQALRCAQSMGTLSVPVDAR